MTGNLEKDFENNLNNYKNNSTPESKGLLIESIIKLDKELSKNYLEELKKYTQKTNDLTSEQKRLKSIVEIMLKRNNDRQNLIKEINELSLDLTLESIPNIDKLKSFTNKLKVVETIINITSKINTSNKEKAIEILSRKEFKMVLIEFSIIANENNEEVERYINSLLNVTSSNNKNNSTEDNNKLKILEFYYNNQNNFPNLNIPNMGLTQDNNNIKIDNNSFFIN